MRRFYLTVAVAGLGWLAFDLAPVQADYLQTNLVSNISGAAHTDPNLKNPWGISFLPGGPFWVSDAGTNVSTLYNASGTPQSLVVSVPGGPTGQVSNSTSDFVLPTGGKASFIFATLGGTIAAWNFGQGTTAATMATVPGASFDGLALGNNGSGNFLYAADNKGGGIDVFNSSFTQVTLSGGFVDPNLPAGFKAYNVQNLGGNLYVTYNGAPGGVVDEFDLNGNFIGRIASNGAGGALNAPWGLALAPASFGKFGGDLLVGNRGNGEINAFSPTGGLSLGTLDVAPGQPFVESGLWGLTFGGSGNDGNPNTLYFAAGIDGYRDGLFGSLTAVPEPSSAALFAVGGLALLTYRRWRGRRS